MTATTTTTIAVDTHRDRAAFRQLRRMARAAGAILGATGSLWNDFVDAGQLGPSADAVTSRHTGGRI